MNNDTQSDLMSATSARPRFATDAVIDSDSAGSHGIIQRTEFRGDRSLYAKKLAAVGVIVLIALGAVGWFYLEERNPKFYMFMGGMAVAITVGRYFTMMGLSGPPAVVFDTTGITIRNGKKTMDIPWANLRSIRNEVVRGGQLWEFTWTGGKFDYFVDGLTGAQKVDLKKTISSIKLPHVKVRVEHYETV
jgi:hypothetical protein